jgi:antitoxin component of MazEF toxin-antitoxin module
MTSIPKGGHRLGVRLPKAFVDQLGLHEGSEIELILRAGEIVIAPPRPHYVLQDLLAGCTPDRRPEPIDWGPDMGGEIL